MLTNKAVVLYSAGLDSAATAFKACTVNDEVTLLYIMYGSRQMQAEMQYGRDFCKWLGAQFKEKSIHWKVLLLPPEWFGESDLQTQVALTVTSDVEVKGRNMLFIGIANSYAAKIGAASIYIGSNRGIDGDVHADSKPKFVFSMAAAVDDSSEGKIDLIAPYCTQEKSAIWQDVREFGIPIAYTYSCYTGGNTHCGTCDACIVRRTSAVAANVEDTTKYDN